MLHRVLHRVACRSPQPWGRLTSVHPYTTRRCPSVFPPTGLTLDSPTRVAVAAQARAARNCPQSRAMATAPFEPRVVTNGYAVDPSSPLTPGQVGFCPLHCRVHPQQRSRASLGSI